LAFGSSPTSGNIVIRIAPLADAAVPTIPFLNTTSTGAGDYGLYSGDCALNAVQNAALTADKEYWTPYLWRGSNEIIQMAVNVTTAQASSGLKVVLAEVNTSGLPGTILINFTADAGLATTTTGVKTRTPGSGRWSPDNTVRVPAGWYYIGFIASHAISLQTLNVRGLSPAGMTTSYTYTADHLERSGSYTTGLASSPSGLSAVIPLYRHVFWLKPRN
jgi:hypothetical protein